MLEKKIMHKYLENPNRSNSKAKELLFQFKKKMQEPTAESSTTILFLKISVFLNTMKLTLSMIIKKFLGVWCLLYFQI